MCRRERTDVLQVFKILHNNEEVNITSNLKLSSNCTTRGHTYKLEKVRPQNRLGQNRFCNRVVNNWNSLTNNTVCADSVNSFKSKLNSEWKHRDNKFTTPGSRLHYHPVQTTCPSYSRDDRSRLGQNESDDSQTANRIR